MSCIGLTAIEWFKRGGDTMKMFKIFRKESASELQLRDEELEEYEVATFVPLKIMMTDDLLRRQREDSIRKKYCRSDKEL